MLYNPHLFLVESVWLGHNDSWRGILSSDNEEDLLKLKEILKWCKKNFIPTVFWNKEDPVHYKRFLKVARYFDYIFTTDKDSIKKYKKDLGHNNVYLLMFAAQPKIHNPIKLEQNRNEKSCFAGTYYKYIYPKRHNDLNNLLNCAITTTGLDIYDRNYKSKLSQFEYPNEYKSFIKGTLPVWDLDIINKGYKININVNTVKDSDTMFSRRVFESLASLTPVVSSYSKGINNIFKDLVLSSDDIFKLKDEFLKLSNDNLYYDKKAIKSMRYVLNNHTYEKRLFYILEKIGINIKTNDIKIAMICNISNIDDIKKAINMYDLQIYKYKKLILIIKDASLKRFIDKRNDIEFILYYNNCKNNIKIFIKDIDYISIMDVRNYYGIHYIEDLVNATLYTDCEFIGKKNHYELIEDKIIEMNHNYCFEYVDSLNLDSCIIKSEILYKYSLEEFIDKITVNIIDGIRQGYRYFSIDKYNFICSYNKTNLPNENVIDTHYSKIKKYVDI